MKLIKITHWRCNEPSAYTFVFAPDEWDDSIISEKLREAQEEYLKTAQVKLGDKPPFKSNIEFYKENPELKVKEVNEIIARENKKGIEWQNIAFKKAKQFSTFLHNVGFISIHEGTKNSYDIDWQHRHGENINYEEDTKIDTTPMAGDFNEN